MAMSSSCRASRCGMPRYETFLAAMIAYGVTPKKRLLCFVRDLTKDGAQLELSSEQALPPRFLFELRNNADVFNARLVWQDGAHVGVSFREPAVAMCEQLLAASA
jgi:hypothetical protein